MSSASVSSALPPVGRPRLLLAFFAVFVLLVVLAIASLPPMDDQERAKLQFPTSARHVRQLSLALSRYRDENLLAVTLIFSLCYIFLQTFAIPGAVFLSMLAGPLFGVWPGLILVSLIATIGASCCYVLSYHLASSVVQRCLPSMLESFRQRIRTHRENLFYYLLFLRISPLLPNWFINISSPLLDIPYRLYIIATFFGLMPANYIHISTGIQLQQLSIDPEESSLVDALSRFAMLFALAFLALLPTLFRSRFEAWEQRLAAKDK